MSSLSLQRVLPGKKNQVEVERETFERTQTAAVLKAVNSQEVPVKEKHARSIILGTYQENGGGTFWAEVLKQSLQANPIICWKFCHVLHKLLREGHQNAVIDSQKYCSHIIELGKLWGHLKEGYGKLIAAYCKLLAEKLTFHRKNPEFHGNLVMSDDRLNEICGADVNNYFELTVEMLDYLDEILTLQQTVFSSLDMSRSNSMTSSGQCRLAPLIQCIQDSCQLYDYVVKSLFKLHSSLPPETLSGHRDRFLHIYNKLKTFYFNSSNLQYFKHLVQVPILSEEPPNFLIAGDFMKHKKPVAVIPADDLTHEETATSILIDTSEDGDVRVDADDKFNSSSEEPTMTVALPDERDFLIEQLRLEIERLKVALQLQAMEKDQLLQKLRDKIESLRDEISALRNTIDEKNEEISCSSAQLELLQSDVTFESQLTDSQNKLKASDEKFKKLKDMYTKLREEHVELIRTHATMSKQFSTEKKLLEEKEQVIKTSQSEIDILESERRLREENLQKSVEDVNSQLNQVLHSNEILTNEKQDLEEEINSLKQQNMSLKTDLEKSQDYRTNLEADLDNLRIKMTDLEAKFSTKEQELCDKLLKQCINDSRELIHDAIDHIDNPSHMTVTCNAEYLLSRTDPLVPLVKDLRNIDIVTKDSKDVKDLIHVLTNISYHTSDCIINGYATSRTCNLETSEDLVNGCKSLGTSGLKVLETIEKGDKVQTSVAVEEFDESLRGMMRIVETLVPKFQDVNADEIEHLVEDEMLSTSKAIEAAAAKFEEILAKARADHSGVQLEVNERILDSCTDLMKAIHVLITRSRDLQKEVIEQGRGTSSTREFYKKNHRWTEGLISAAKAVGWGASALLNAADKVIMGEAKFEELMVCSQEVAASTAQLVVASKVKAARDSSCLSKLSEASKDVSKATGNVVASAKAGVEMVEESNLMDFTKLSLTQTKKLEMQSQVRVLELENLLEKERVKLGTLRKQHYQLAGESEGWEQKDQDDLDAEKQIPEWKRELYDSMISSCDEV